MSHLDNGFRSLNLKRFPETDDVNPLRRGKRRMNICCSSWMTLKSAARF
jgi:hypothetical protein